MASTAEPSGSSSRPSSAGVSTGMKMLLILTAAFLPLGLIALFASIQSAHSKRLQREADARVIATAEARQIDIVLLRAASIVRNGLAEGALTSARCDDLLAAVRSAFPAPVPIRLYEAGGRPGCGAGPLLAPSRPPQTPMANLRVLARPGGLLLTVGGPNGSYGTALLDTAMLRQVLPTSDPTQGIAIRQANDRLVLSNVSRENSLAERLTVGAQIGGGQAELVLTLMTNLITAVEVLLVLLPLMMWAAAAVIGWLVIDQLLLRPLAQLQRTVSAYGGEGPFVLPRLSTPSQEIRALGQAFEATTNQLAHRETELEQGLNHQVRLTREVHHRVKNNLQVVASLINLHSRGTKGEVQAAYASIQRRVDALAVVHRNHYAELEKNSGVALRSIVAELTANLRATAPPAAAHMVITLDMAPAFVSQDVAVPVAFLVTEIVELVMDCTPTGRVAIALALGDRADRATLSFESEGLALAICREHPSHEGFERIVTGLSRQLRAPLDYEPAAGRYEVEIAIVPPGEPEKKI